MKTKKTGQNVHVLNGYIAALEYELRQHTEALLKVTQGSAPKNEKSLMMGIHGHNIQRLQNLIAD
mgnify:CR=1 FL=1